jgi:hypothetical protein
VQRRLTGCQFRFSLQEPRIAQSQLIRSATLKGATMSIWRWNSLIDSVAEPHQISLGEGNTPLIQSKSIGPQAGLSNLFF